MKRINTSHSTDHQVLAQTIYDRNEGIMYDKGTPLTVFVRTRILLEGYETIDVYENQAEYQVQEVIRPDFQKKTMQQLRHLAHISEVEDHGPEEIRLNMIRAMMGSVVEDFLNETMVMEKLLSMKRIHEYLYQHSVGVMITSLLLGTSMGLEKAGLRKLGLSAMLHDMGMLFIPDHIMQKEKLSPDEYKIIQNHPMAGYRFLKENTQLEEEILLPVLQHQERWDGTGYPEKLSGDAISLHGQVIGLADMFDSMTTDRVYRKAFPISEAYEYIMGDAGQQFNPRLIQEFITNINPYPPNTLVELNDKSLGVVMKSNSPFHTRPVLNMIKGPLKGQKVDLLQKRNLVIVRTVAQSAQ